VLPWWEAPDLRDEGGPDDYAEAPAAVEAHLVEGIRPPLGSGARLAHNAIAICLAYLHTLLTLRLPSLHPAHLSQQHLAAADVKSALGSLVPFLVEPRSTVRYDNARSAYSAVWEAVAVGHDTAALPIASAPEAPVLPRLLELVSRMVHPPVLLAPPKLVLVLADVYRLFAVPQAGAAAPRKVLFYLAALGQLRRDDWLRLECEVQREVDELRYGVDAVEEVRPNLKLT